MIDLEGPQRENGEHRPVEETVASADTEAESSRLLRTRAMVGIVALSWAAYSLRVVATTGTVTIFHIAGLSLTLVLYIAIWKSPRFAPLATHLTLLTAILGIVGLALTTGQIKAPALWYLTCVPLFAAYTLGIRAAFGWSVAAAGAIALVEASRHYVPLPAEYLTPESEQWLRMIGLVAVVLAFAVITKRAHAAQLKVAEAREQVIRNLADGLSIKNEETLRARDTALAASRAKGEFLAMMSHEIRTPLNAVLGLTGVLLDGQLASEQREIVRTIRSSGDSLLLLLNDILDFSKIEAGRLQLERTPFDVVDCAEDALDLFGAVAADKGLDLSCSASPDVPGRVFGDSGRVRQILVNLVSNAIKFTLRGSVQVEIDADPASVVDSDVDTRIHCSVRDSGIGIPEDHLSTLFQPFSQVDASTTRRFGGTGLGLAICRTLAERMGGRVWAESSKGKGSTFHFTFLARTMPEIRTTEVMHLAEHGVIVLCPREGTRRAAVTQVRDLGMRVAECSSPSELQAALDLVRPDVVLADETVSPSEVRSALSKLHRLPAFVLLSTAVRDSEARRSLRARWGPEPWIVSLPLRRTALRDAVIHALGFDETPAPRSSGVPPLSNELPLRILVAEDNPVNQRVALLLLERLGYRADVAGNGVEAVEAVRNRPYDLVLMDVRMPELDGIEATKRIRAEVPPERQPRIVALTANAMAEDRKACEAAQMDDFISKPITPGELERVLRASPSRATPHTKGSPLGGAELAALVRLTAGTPDALRQIVDEFRESAARLIRQIALAIDSGDVPLLEQSAHSLKGCSAQMGAQQLMLESASVEIAASAGDLEGAAGRLPALRQKHERVLAALSELTAGASR